MIKEICKDTEFLSKKCTSATEDDLATVTDLRDTLAANREGCVGLAANMLGVDRRIIIFECNGEDVVMLNPVILKKSGMYWAEEGCLSHEGTRKALRYRTIKVQYQNEQLQLRCRNYTDFTAEIIQHELDHCDGILI